MKKTQKPTMTNKKDGVLELKHDAFGTIKINRVFSSGNITLFGSNVKHSTFISVEISHATLDRHLGRDWVHADEPVVSIALSEAQWAQMVASIGNGSGIPCTIEDAPPRGTRIDMIPSIENIENIQETFTREMEEHVSESIEKLSQLVLELEELTKRPSVSKTALKATIHSLRCTLDNLPSNLSFTKRQFETAMDKTMADAKIEFESFVSSTLTHTGIEAMNKDQLPKLPLPDKNEE